ncbi:hypothetical protein QJS04_geneDACA002376 [Acorus gramineus]|uniref:Diphthine--ammonia ligase n=1 Tax=Acorus gramineus TaxID=55184 RepID=A0AAV9A8S7_ACOGR|nr:hypothetical protein QJS04_geneDACA002376 [Acorus gramineus]
MKTVGLVSGGKDSCYAMMKCVEYGHEIVALANLMPLDDSVDELDSYMYQTVGHQIVISYAECMGLPLFRRRIHGSTKRQHLTYEETTGDEVEDMFILLSEVKRQFPSIMAVSSGAIASDYQRLRVESVCSRLGLVSLAYLWKQDQSLLLQEMIRNGIMAITIKVAAMGLKPSKHLGVKISELQQELLQLNELYGINVCGEGGEYETLTLDCPLFINAHIILDNSQVVLHSTDSIASVGILHPSAFHLEYKSPICSISSNFANNGTTSEKVGYVHEVRGDCVSNDLVKCQSTDVGLHKVVKNDLLISRTGGNLLSIGCWIQDSLNSEGLQEDLTSILWKLETELQKNGFDWVDVLYIHLYISDMDKFSLANDVYLRFITEKKCNMGVPSRSTVELPLVQVGLGKAYVEVLVTNDNSKRVLHVQSISCWAPSCIGPYSQATLHKEILYMAGQLGLDPPTMMLCTGGATAEMDQALKNCEAVAKSFNCSLGSSAIIFVIYCSAALTSSERTEIQCKQEGFKECTSCGTWNSGSVIFLYVLVPNLPKRALVEIKPVLYIPNDAESFNPPELQSVRSINRLIDWGFVYSNRHDSCCQKYVVKGKLCGAVVSITNSIVTEICSESGENSSPFKHCSSEKQMRRIAKFCVYRLDRILFENNFSWGDVTILRFYFSVGLVIPINKIRHAFEQAFEGLAEIDQSLGKAKEPVFNLIPTLGSGRTSAMDDIITCELFATKI